MSSIFLLVLSLSLMTLAGQETTKECRKSSSFIQDGRTKRREAKRAQEELSQLPYKQLLRKFFQEPNLSLQF